MLEIENLKTNFNTYDGVVEALNGVNLTVKDGEIFGLVGETGCGKSVTSLSIMRSSPCHGKRRHAADITPRTCARKDWA